MNEVVARRFLMRNESSIMLDRGFSITTEAATETKRQPQQEACAHLCTTCATWGVSSLAAGCLPPATAADGALNRPRMDRRSIDLEWIYVVTVTTEEARTSRGHPALRGPSSSSSSSSDPCGLIAFAIDTVT